MQTSPKRIAFLTILAVVLGLAGGAAAFALVHLIALLTNVFLFHRLSLELPRLRTLHPGPGLFAAAAGGGLLIALLAKWSPNIRGHGIPEAMEAILENQSRIKPRTAIAKPLSAAIAIGTGGPFGAEGPIIVTGGSIGSLIGQVVRVTPSERKILLASGAAAGMAATFGSPLAAVVLAIELLLFEFSTRALIPLVVASATAAGVHSVVFGSGPLFDVPRHNYAGLGKLPLFAVLGVLCGLLAVLLTRGLFAVESGYRRLPVSEFWHPVIGGLCFAVVGAFVPAVLGVGYDVIGDILAGRLALSMLVTILLAKYTAWALALGSGTSGGTLAPVLMMGGAFGGIVGALFAHAFPTVQISPSAFAVVAMAATFGAATRATFASIVFLFEITQDYRVILPLMVATVLADLTMRAIMNDSLLTEKLTRRGIRVHGDYNVDVLQTTVVRQIMTTAVETIALDATVSDAREIFATRPHGAYPIVEDASLRGVVARGDLIRYEGSDEEAIERVASTDVVCVVPTATVREALQVMIEEKVEHLPVVDEGRLLGICTRTDVMKLRRREFEHERPQPGLFRRTRDRVR
jgi:chloride channel protein, CIC family